MTYIITTKSQAGTKLYFDGIGFSLLAANALVMSPSQGIAARSAICHEYPDCKLIQNEGR